ncbi:acetoin utilization AcuB family protein [Peribacillus asahii]|uniref:acetoin utilization AcuB family protein n=1 Tax=Peribacillus asahii TaxID=228899 RepID=UPI003802AFFD
MIVEKMMTKNVMTLAPTDTIYSALLLINEKKIRHIPIVDQNNYLIGLVSDRDLRDATPSIFRTEEFKEDLYKPISSIMKTNIISGHPLDFVEEIGAIFCENNISCLPIVKEKKLVGIITSSDLLQAFIELTGVNKPGSQIEIKIPDKPGILHDIYGIFKKRNVNIHSVLIYPEKADHTSPILVVRAQTINPFIVIEDLRKEGYEVLWPTVSGQFL